MLSFFHRVPINYLLVNLAVSDILYVTFISPNVFIIQFSFTNLPDGVTGTVLCKFFTTGTVAWVGAASSILTLAVVAIERYYAVVYPLGNKEKITMDTLKVSPKPSCTTQNCICLAKNNVNSKPYLCERFFQPPKFWQINAAKQTKMPFISFGSREFILFVIVSEQSQTEC